MILTSIGCGNNFLFKVRHARFINTYVSVMRFGFTLYTFVNDERRFYPIQCLSWNNTDALFSQYEKMEMRFRFGSNSLTFVLMKRQVVEESNVAHEQVKGIFDVGKSDNKVGIANREMA